MVKEDGMKSREEAVTDSSDRSIFPEEYINQDNDNLLPSILPTYPIAPA